MSRAPAAIRPPVALGCTALAAVVVFSAFVVGGCIIFLESGSDDGKVTLQSADSYPPNSVTPAGDEGLFVARLETALIVLSDEDPVTNDPACRVELAGPDDPSFRDLAERYATVVSPPAEGTALLFVNGCDGAVFDAAGARLDGPGPNLDRFPSETDARGNLVVDTGERQCTAREGDDYFAPQPCS